MEKEKRKKVSCLNKCSFYITILDEYGTAQDMIAPFKKTADWIMYNLKAE